MNKRPRARIISMPKPEAPPVIPEMPKPLEGAALEHWNWHAAELAQCGLLNEFTAHFFMVCCYSWAHYCAISDQIFKDGLQVQGPRGRMVSHPLLSEQFKALKVYRMFAKDTGIIPIRRRQ